MTISEWGPLVALTGLTLGGIGALVKAYWDGKSYDKHLNDVEKHLRDKIGDLDTRLAAKVSRNTDILNELQSSIRELRVKVDTLIRDAELAAKRFSEVETRLHGGATEFASLRERVDGVKDRITAIEVSRAASGRSRGGNDG